MKTWMTYKIRTPLVHNGTQGIRDPAIYCHIHTPLPTGICYRCHLTNIDISVIKIRSCHLCYGYPYTCQNGFILKRVTNIFRITGYLCREFPVTSEFPAKRPVTRSFDVFFGLRLNERLSKRSWGWWFETPSGPVWHHSNIIIHIGRLWYHC